MGHTYEFTILLISEESKKNIYTYLLNTVVKYVVIQGSTQHQMHSENNLFQL